MRAPKKRYEGRYTGAQQWNPPDDEWLNHHYWILEKSTNQIARELGCRSNVVLCWMKAAGVRLRTKMERDRLHAVTMAGALNPAFVHGTGSGARSRRCRKKLWASNKQEACMWCGVSADNERLEAHHKNHDRRDESIQNLVWMCLTCHRMETWIWKAKQRGKVEVTVCEDGLKLTFPNLRDKQRPPPTCSGSTRGVAFLTCDGRNVKRRLR